MAKHRACIHQLLKVTKAQIANFITDGSNKILSSVDYQIFQLEYFGILPGIKDLNETLPPRYISSLEE